MNIRQAMLKAADSIEVKPELFRFTSIHIPHDCDTPGCALGLIGYFAGASGLSLICVPPLLGLNGDWWNEAHVFYDRMGAFHDDWRHSAKNCADALRKYADKYHPADNQGIPENILAILNEKAVA